MASSMGTTNNQRRIVQGAILHSHLLVKVPSTNILYSMVPANIFGFV